jgi:hypothetical protein
MSILRFFKNPSWVFGGIILLGITLHWDIWNRDIMGIHAWRQTQTMTVVENFAAEDMNILNPRFNCRGNGDGIERMEFPLMQWSFSWFYKWFGHHLAIIRILTFIIGILGVFGFYKLIRAHGQTHLTAAIGAWCYSWSPVLFYYSVNPLPDNLALCLGIWSLVFLKKHEQFGTNSSLFGFAVFLSLATAVKLPFVLFGAGYLPIFWRHVRNVKVGKIGVNSLLLLMMMSPALAWYFWVIPHWGNAGIVTGITTDAGFDINSAISTIWGTLHSLLPELLLNYGSVLFFVIGVVVIIRSKTKLMLYGSELFILFFLLLFYLYEVNMIGLAHDYYLFPFLPLLFLTVTVGAKRIVEDQKSWVRVIGMIALVILPFTAYLRAIERWEPMGGEAAIHEHKEELRNLIPDSALVVVGNDASRHIMLYHIHKKGWTFEQDWLRASDLEDYIDNGAAYLYSNTDHVERSPNLKRFLDEPIFDKSGIRVYPLKKVTDS